jgi:hypothetical protein
MGALTYSVKHLFGSADRNADFEPVSRGGPNQVFLRDGMRGKPLVYELDALGTGGHELLHRGLGQVLAIPRMIGIAHFIQVLLQEFEVTLRQTNAKVDDVVRRDLTTFRPVARGSYYFPDLEPGVSRWDATSQEGREGDRERQEPLHGSRELKRPKRAVLVRDIKAGAVSNRVVRKRVRGLHTSSQFQATSSLDAS